MHEVLTYYQYKLNELITICMHENVINLIRILASEICYLILASARSRNRSRSFSFYDAVIIKWLATGIYSICQFYHIKSKLHKYLEMGEKTIHESVQNCNNQPNFLTKNNNLLFTL